MMKREKKKADDEVGAVVRIAERNGAYWRLDAEELPPNHHLRTRFLLPREILCDDGNPLAGRLVRVEYRREGGSGGWRATEFVDEAT